MASRVRSPHCGQRAEGTNFWVKFYLSHNHCTLYGDSTHNHRTVCKTVQSLKPFLKRFLNCAQRSNFITIKSLDGLCSKIWVLGLQWKKCLPQDRLFAPEGCNLAQRDALDWRLRHLEGHNATRGAHIIATMPWKRSNAVLFFIKSLLITGKGHNGAQ